MDGDIFTRKARGAWKAVAAAFRDGSVELCAEQVERAIARDLRERGGVQALGLSEAGPPPADHIVLAMEQSFRREVVDRVGPILIGRGRFATYDDVHVFVDQVNRIARFDSLAGQVQNRPDGSHIRKPPRRRVASAVLLNEGAPLGDLA